MTEPTEPIEADIAELRSYYDCDERLGAERFAALTRLLDYVEAFKWRPIDGKAKNGAWILLRGRNSIGAKMVPVVARWGVSPTNRFSYHSWWDAASAKDLVSMVADSRGDADWMPLPPPPVKGEKG